MDELASDLNELLHYETSSLMQFMGEATPYVSLAMAPAWKTVQAMVAQAADREGRLTGLLASQRWTARPGMHDPEVAGLQYSRLEALLPMLVKEAVDNVATLERAISHAAAHPDIAAVLSILLDEHRAELTKLEGFVVPAP